MMTRNWTLLAVLTLSVSGAASAETAGLRGTFESAPVATSIHDDDELLGGPVATVPTINAEPTTITEGPESFAYEAYAVEPAAPEFVSVRYDVPEMAIRAPKPARAEGLLTWQGRNF